eukprot:1519371-Lingulodinium_polyedra.AAC.1
MSSRGRSAAPAGTSGPRTPGPGGAGRLYKWIKAGAPPTPTLVPDPAVDREAGGDGAPVSGSRSWTTAMWGPAA